jgi:serine/threonine protein kinase
MDSQLQNEQKTENGRLETTFHFEKKAGAGAFGTVYVVQNKNDKCHYAIKQIPVFSGSTKAIDNSVMANSSTEAMRLARVQGHVNVVQYYSSWFEESFWAQQVSTDGEKSEYSEKPSGHQEEIRDVQPVTSRLGSVPSESDNRSLRSTSVSTGFTLPKSDLILYIQLELCNTTLLDWMKERDELLKNPNKVRNLELGEHVCRALRRWVKSENTLADSSAEFNRHAPSNHRYESKKQWELISAECANSCLEGIVSGLNYLHSKQLAHGDIAARNILLLVTEAGEVIPKLNDFGGAKTLSRISNNIHTLELKDGRVIDLRQTEERIPIDPYSYDKASKNDMMSLATIIFDLYHPPVSETETWDFEKITDWESFKECFVYQARWIEQLVSGDYDKRPTSVDILREGKDKVFNSERVKREILEADLLQLRHEKAESSRQLRDTEAELSRLRRESEAEISRLRHRIEELEAKGD